MARPSLRGSAISEQREFVPATWRVKWATVHLAEKRAHFARSGGRHTVAPLGATTAPSHWRTGPPPREEGSAWDRSEV